MVTETALQKHERIKREQNPWEELPRLLAALRGGFSALAPEDLNTRLRWWGLYTQGDGDGAFGDAAPYFMLRIRIPNGLLTAAQTGVIAEIARRHGRGIADVTVRQNIQLHWLAAESLPEILETLADAGLTSQAACGDDPRNLTGCPLAGLDPTEYADASPLTLAVNRALLANGDYYNLPRKFKLCLTGCRQWCPNPEINDVAFTALPPSPGDSGVWFGLRVGGGLSTAPLLAKPLPVRVAWDEVVPVACAITALFRDCAELRQNRGQARLKFLFLRYGWTVERFRAELESRLGYRLQDAEPGAPPEAEFRDHLGLNPQKQPGLWYAGLSVLRGRLSADQLAAVAEAAERWGAGEVRATAMQNLVVTGVPANHHAALAGHLERWGLPIAASAFRRGVMSCTGKEFCKLAVTETKTFAATLVEELERRMPGFPVPLRINLNGCPNSCGQHWIADVGLQGMRVKTAQGPADGFDVFLGGGLGSAARLARKTLGRVLALELPDRLEALFRHFWAARVGEESFRDFVERQGVKTLEAML
ncbi:MAG TPA: nitrite/sulfite reductase, partial [Candidatus Sulfopaludibacter sp.]|nr:nitrite/sulfite reductase [Candidatus Sulfopaludibacter sp.]